MKSIITGQEIDSNTLQGRWQQFAISQQNGVYNASERAEGYQNAMATLAALLEEVNDKKVRNLISEQITNLETIVAYIHYGKGLVDGIKILTRLEIGAL